MVFQLRIVSLPLPANLAHRGRHVETSSPLLVEAKLQVLRLTKVDVAPACSGSHIPGYIASPKLKDAGKVFVVSVNDAFV